MRIPRRCAYPRRACHSRSKRTWSSSAPGPAAASQSSIQYPSRMRKETLSSSLTGESGSARRAGEPANRRAREGMAPPRSKTPPPRIQIERVWPQLDCGRYPVKRTLGEGVDVWADIFRDGHEVLRAAVRFRRAGARRWREAAMQEVESDRWTGAFEPDELGLWEFTVAAWTDRWVSWRWELERKVNAGQEDLAGELSEGAALLGRESLTVEEALEPALAPRLRPDDVTTLPAPLAVDVDRPLARVGAWYELFPRSWGGFAGVEKLLPQLAELGFDVLYFPPIHPIGRSGRKGRNNTLPAKP